MGTSVVFRCTLCGKTAAQKNNLLNHIEGIHFPNSFRYNCPYCAKTLTTKNALSVHVHTTHKQQQPQPLVFQNLPGMPGGLTFPTLPMPPFPMPALPSPKPWKETKLSEFLLTNVQYFKNIDNLVPGSLKHNLKQSGSQSLESLILSTVQEMTGVSWRDTLCEM